MSQRITTVMEDLYKYLETDYSLSVDIGSYLRQIEAPNEEVKETVHFERILLEMNIEAFIDKWEDGPRGSIQEYCEKRLLETGNCHLKAKYGWNLWVITGRHDNKLLHETIDLIISILESYLEKDDFKHADAFCDYCQKIDVNHCSMGRDREKKFVGLINQAFDSNNYILKFQVLAMIFHQVKEGKSGLRNKVSIKKLVEVALKMTAAETDCIKLDRLLEFAVFFADRAGDATLQKKAYERLGDYKITHLFPDDEKNIAIAHLNDFMLREAMACYKRAMNAEKLRQATLAYEANKSKLRYLTTTGYVPVERRCEEIDKMNKYIVDVVNGGTSAIMNLLFGEGVDVFLSAEIMGKTVQDNAGKYFYQKVLNAVNKDTFQNSRHTTHDKNALHMMANYAYGNVTFHIFALVIYNGLKKGTLSYEMLKESMLKRGFSKTLNKYDADGKEVGSTYFDRVDIGIKDFLQLLTESVEGKDVDWRYCISFLTTQFEGLFREIMRQHNIPVVKLRGETNTELVLLEGLLNDKQINELFSENDLLLFKQTFTKDGYNIRNEVAHGMYVPQEFTAKKAMLVFLCVLRLCKPIKRCE